MAPPAAFAALSVGARVPQGDIGQLSWNKPGLAQVPEFGSGATLSGQSSGAFLRDGATAAL
eukprot:CAMPEP_0183423638 /NCGR_PEP_ID=MMETSP0370-20130417/28628_1 /TAXON_ID=268820 /ORGANISM="Peridinium aciculiferum, Strain PAER-2" /LENGTH=60 /DNA_ID=CAMNT_0025607847 /DNA_START=1 /DNA_END=180 /DNA_ORIENTATION=+